MSGNITQEYTALAAQHGAVTEADVNKSLQFLTSLGIVLYIPDPAIRTEGYVVSRDPDPILLGEQECDRSALDHCG